MGTLSLEGQSLGKYQILQPLGAGGMARVYKAYHPQLDRYVAIKVLRPDLVGEEEFLDRFRREAQSVAALRHPNVVQVFDFDVHDDIYYMVMELLDGDNLKTRMNEYRAHGQIMPYGEMIKMQLDVLSGLGYAHSQGMVHRDIKPANIILTRTGHAVLADFGIVQIVGATRHTVSGALIGTLNYMAPEQGLRGQSDARSDLYSLGVVFYELLTGRPPFDADTPLAILMKHVNDPLPRPSLVNPRIPPSFERVVLKVLSKEPADRYQTAAEMSQALQQAAQEAGVSLPEKISSPFQFTTPVAPGEAVAVYSGGSRPSEAEAGFARDDTANMTIPPVFAPPPSSSFAEDSENSGNPKNIEKILTGAFSIPIWNICMLIICGVTNRWDAFSHAWPAELLLVAFMLSLIMESVGALGLIIPIYIMAATGTLLAYFALLNVWGQWYLWLLLPLVIFGTIRYLVVKEAELKPEENYAHSVNLGKDMTQISLGLIAVVTVIAFFNPFIK